MGRGGEGWGDGCRSTQALGHRVTTCLGVRNGFVTTNAQRRAVAVLGCELRPNRHCTAFTTISV